MESRRCMQVFATELVQQLSRALDAETHGLAAVAHPDGRVSRRLAAVAARCGTGHQASPRCALAAAITPPSAARMFEGASAKETATSSVSPNRSGVRHAAHTV